MSFMSEIDETIREEERASLRKKLIKRLAELEGFTVNDYDPMLSMGANRFKNNGW